ncbi:MAG: 5'/3'-nucleotidase SurE [Acidobacteria bacterium]|nr:5'/3'-nucleotidase SurE [Acidobacteriota bacterium]
MSTRPVRTPLILLAAAWLLAPVQAQQFRQVPPYYILVTNDDGVRAPGIAAVAQALQVIGTPVIVAPADNQTGKGQSVVTAEPVFRQDMTLPNGLPAIGLTSTPASTVSIAISNIVKPRPDLVVSGVNTEYNLGLSTEVSGTVGAAREAARHGIPAIAASMSGAAFPRDLVFAAEEVVWVARRVKQYGLPPNTFLNVNIPGVPPGGYKGYQITRQGQVRTGQEGFAEMKHPSGRTIYWSVYNERVSAPQPEGTDFWAVENGYVSVTPMSIDETDRAQFDALKAIFK